MGMGMGWPLNTHGLPMLFPTDSTVCTNSSNDGGKTPLQPDVGEGTNRQFQGVVAEGSSSGLIVGKGCPYG